MLGRSGSVSRTCGRPDAARSPAAAGSRAATDRSPSPSRSPASASASRRDWSQPCAISPVPPSGGWAQSPIAKTRGSSGLARSCPTTTPRSTARPAARASPASGIVPHASTTRSASTSTRRVASAPTPPGWADGATCAPSSGTRSVTPRTWPPSRRTRSVRARVQVRTPRPARLRATTPPAAWSSWRSMTLAPPCTRLTVTPRRASPHATSSPSTPAPTTTACRALTDAATISRASSRVRSARTPPGSPPGRSVRPGRSGTRAAAPVASTTTSYGYVPSPVTTRRASRSIARASVPRRTVTRASSAPGSVIAATSTLPATTSLSSTRLYGSYSSAPSTVTSTGAVATPGPQRDTRSLANREPTMPLPTTTTRVIRPPPWTGRHLLAPEHDRRLTGRRRAPAARPRRTP